MTAVPGIPIIPDLSSFCIQVLTGPGELCITFPGGVELCASVGVSVGDPAAIVTSLLAQVNSALMPLAPFFDVLNVVKAVGDCVQAIPDCLGPLPDPRPLLQCIPGLVEALEKLLELLPIFTIPKMIKGILETIITGLMGLRQKLAAMIAQSARIIAAGTKAAKVGGRMGQALQHITDCASSNLTAQLANENAALLPLNRLIGVMNLLLKIVGLPCIPTLGGLGALTDEVLAPLDAAIKVLQAIASAIPIGLTLPAIPGPNDPC